MSGTVCRSSVFNSVGGAAPLPQPHSLRRSRCVVPGPSEGRWTALLPNSVTIQSPYQCGKKHNPQKDAECPPSSVTRRFRGSGPFMDLLQRQMGLLSSGTQQAHTQPRNHVILIVK